MRKIHGTALVDVRAELGEDVEVGPYAVIGPHVRIGAGTRVMAHAVIDGHTTIGERCEIFPMASVGQKTQDLKYRGGVTYLEIGHDTVIREFVTINTATNEGKKTVVGNHVLLMAYCHVAHECVVGDHVIMANVATLAGDVVVEDYAVLGGMAGVHQFCRIGRMAMVGACTKVVQDVVPYTIVDGNPAVACGVNKVRMERVGLSEERQRAVVEAYKVIFRQGLKAKEAVERLRAEFREYEEVQHMANFIERSGRGIVR
ncbi:MAG: acyl-ACP--UDP-N-acetylglucosamine O-acyltransferase [bacterium]|nr:acyl-ACP--UDP-N-acetylglucosamine O-acyltransferase [bacterium]